MSFTIMLILLLIASLVAVEQGHAQHQYVFKSPRSAYNHLLRANSFGVPFVNATYDYM
jgi:hypothetical protein